MPELLLWEALDAIWAVVRALADLPAVVHLTAVEPAPPRPAPICGADPAVIWCL